MKDLNQLYIMQHVLDVLIAKIGKRTSKGFAAVSISKAIMVLRDEYDCFNYVIINENRYTEGGNSLTVSEEINTVDSYEFYSSLKALIEKTFQCIDTTSDIYFVNEVRESLSDVFYTINNLEEIEKNKDKQKIILVDDDPDLIETVTKVLDKISDEYEIIGANSGVEFFDLLGNGLKPDLILLDIMMPGVDGWNVFTRLKENECWREIPIVFLTAKTDSFSKGFGRFSADDYITKPFDVEDLKNRIDKILKERKNYVKEK